MNSFKNFVGLLVLTSLIISCKKESSSPVESNFIPAINPPLPNANIKYDQYRLNPKKDTIIYHKSGAVLEIPKNAFLNSKGEIVTDSVDIEFRTFSNPLEIYLAGIPMNFTNDKQEEFVFESAGMFEINVNLPEDKLKVNPNNKINITLNSFTNDSNFNTYDFNQDTKVWIETGKDKINNLSKSEALSKLPELPIAPKFAPKFAFQVKDEKNETNSLAEYKNVWFEPIDTINFRNTGKDIKVKDLKNGMYEVTFKSWLNLKKDSDKKVICYLAFNNAKDYSIALRKYKEKYAQRIKKDKQKRKKIERDWAIYDKQFKEYKLFFAKSEIEKTYGSQKIIRSLEVNNFGFTNIDRPIDYPQGANINPIYVDQFNNKITLKEVVLVEIGRNSLFRFSNEIKFNPANDNLLWGLTNEGKLAYLTKENFKLIDKLIGRVTLKMQVHPVELNSYDEIMAVLFPNK